MSSAFLEQQQMNPKRRWKLIIGVVVLLILVGLYINYKVPLIKSLHQTSMQPAAPATTTPILQTLSDAQKTALMKEILSSGGTGTASTLTPAQKVTEFQKSIATKPTNLSTSTIVRPTGVQTTDGSAPVSANSDTLTWEQKTALMQGTLPQ